MARFFTIASGSSGNSTFVGGGGGGVLVDAGVSCKAITAGLAANGVDLNQLRAIFITHEHIDHIRGLKVLLKKCDVPVFASASVLDYLTQNDHVPPCARLEPMQEEGAQAGGMEIAAFRTSHDSVHSLGYRIHTADDRTIGVFTDLGYISDTVRGALLGCDLILLESNYEHTMLMNGAYPYYLKKRIASDCGHLSNDACAALLPELIQTGCTRVILGHLSRENNLPELAYQTSLAALNAAQLAVGSDFLLSVAPRSEPSPLHTF